MQSRIEELSLNLLVRKDFSALILFPLRPSSSQRSSPTIFFLLILQGEIIRKIYSSPWTNSDPPFARNKISYRINKQEPKRMRKYSVPLVQGRRYLMSQCSKKIFNSIIINQTLKAWKAFDNKVLGAKISQKNTSTAFCKISKVGKTKNSYAAAARRFCGLIAASSGLQVAKWIK